MLIVVLLMMVVNFLLLFAASRLMGGDIHIWQLAFGSLVGAILMGLCVVTGFSFMGQLPWRIVCLLLTAVIAFGITKETVWRALLFSLLHLSLGGVTGAQQEISSLLLGALGIGFACLVVGRRKNLIPIELTYDGQTFHLTALRDTGHTLRDPISGRAVLVVDACVAKKLTGLEPAVLCDPVNNIGKHPGLRLIPYQSVGNTGFLLALQVQNAKIGNRQENILVALSPNLLGNRYQALTGGAL